MTKLLDRALEAARTLPDEAQDDIARIVLQLAGGEEAQPILLTPDECEAIGQSKDAARSADFATDDEVRAIWRKHGL